MSEVHMTGGASSPAERYRVLLEIAQALGSTMGTNELYGAIHGETSRVLEVDGFYVSLLNRGADQATVAFWAEGGSSSSEETTYPADESPVFRTRRAVLVHDRLEDDSLVVLGAGGRESTRSAISAPMRVGGQVVGAISAQSYRAHAYDESDLELLQGIADLAAMAAQNAGHITTLETRRREAEAMEDIVRTLVSSLDGEDVLSGVIAAVEQLLPASGAAVWLPTKGGDGIRLARSVGSLAADRADPGVLDGRLALLLGEGPDVVAVEDPTTDPRLADALEFRLGLGPLILAPLFPGQDNHGMLVVQLREGVSLDDDAVGLVRRLAGHAAVALRNADLHARLRELSLTDPLTGLPNRRHLEIHLEREFAAAQRGRALSVVLFDLDNFKRYNDAFGHLAGDKVLTALGEVLTGATRTMNLVARYGGDEFVAVLSTTPIEGARLHASRVEEEVRHHPGLRPHGVTITSGAAAFDPSMKSIHDLVRAADQDMYRTKEARRVET